VDRYQVVECLGYLLVLKRLKHREELALRLTIKALLLMMMMRMLSVLVEEMVEERPRR